MRCPQVGALLIAGLFAGEHTLEDTLDPVKTLLQLVLCVSEVVERSAELRMAALDALLAGEVAITLARDTISQRKG
jgi:hypothetical protein